jgi:hypothetical protein
MAIRGLPQPGAQFTDTVYADDDPLLRAQLQMGGRGGMVNGAGAFLGAAYNPFGFETGPSEGEIIRNDSRPEHSMDQLFSMADQLGMDTSGYSRDYSPSRYGFLNNLSLEDRLDPTRGGVKDARSLYNDLNDYTKDYYAIDHMTPDGKSMERTLYLHRNGQYVPVSDPQRRSSRQDTGFFGDEFKEALSTVGLAALGGYLAAPAAGAGQAAGSGVGAAASGASQVGTQGLWQSLPNWGRQALTGALRGGLNAGLNGGNILQGALTGGVSGGAGSVIGDVVGDLGLPKWASGGLTGALRGGLGSALSGGDILQGALSGGLSGGLSGAGVPSGLANIGGRVLAGALNDSDGGGSAQGGSTPSMSAPDIGVLAAGIGGGGSSGGIEQTYDPNDARRRALLASALLNRKGRAGDATDVKKNALIKVLEETA